MVVLAVSVLAAMIYGHENCRVFSRTRSIDLYFVSYGEFGELIMKLLRAALGLSPSVPVVWLLAAHARVERCQKSHNT